MWTDRLESIPCVRISLISFTYTISFNVSFGGASVADPEGIQGVRSNPPCPTFLNIL